MGAVNLILIGTTMQLTQLEIEYIKQLKNLDYWDKYEMNDSGIIVYYIHCMYHLYECPIYGGPFQYVASIHASCFEDLIDLIKRLT